MSLRDIERDERTVAVENAGYRWSYHVLAFGVLGLAAYRAFARHDQSWDLIGLVVASGVVSTLYQASRRTLYRRWMVMTVVTFAVSALLGAAIMFVRRAP